MPSVVMMHGQHDAHLAKLAIAGVKKHWPEMSVRVFLDSEVPESSVPDDIRSLIRMSPPLKRIFDIVPILDVEKLYWLDADCFVLKRPDDFEMGMFQPGTEQDSQDGVDAWAAIGKPIPYINPQMCVGLYSCHRKTLLECRDDCIEFLREVVREGRAETRRYGYQNRIWEFEQTMNAGVFKRAYPCRPLCPRRYPLYKPTPEAVIFHATGFKDTEAFSVWLQEYERAL